MSERIFEYAALIGGKSVGGVILLDFQHEHYGDNYGSVRIDSPKDPKNPQEIYLNSMVGALYPNDCTCQYKYTVQLADHG